MKRPVRLWLRPIHAERCVSLDCMVPVRTEAHNLDDIPYAPVDEERERLVGRMATALRNLVDEANDQCGRGYCVLDQSEFIDALRECEDALCDYDAKARGGEDV